MGDCQIFLKTSLKRIQRTGSMVYTPAPTAPNRTAIIKQSRCSTLQRGRGSGSTWFCNQQNNCCGHWYAKNSRKPVSN